MRIAITNLKGGVGKTITAVHVAAALSEHANTLLIDADPHRSALSWSQKTANFPCRVIAYPFPDLLGELLGAPAPALGMDTTVDNGTVEAAHVVIDTPPNDERISRGAVRAADTVIIPLMPSTMDLDRLVETLQLISDVEPEHAVDVRILLVAVRRRTRLADDARAVLGEFGAPLMDAWIPMREAYRAAFGAPPAPQVDYDQVVHEILNTLPAGVRHG